MPANPQRGGQRRDHRLVITGMLWKRRTGTPAHRRTVARSARSLWCVADRRRSAVSLAPGRHGPWDRILAQVQTQSDAVGAMRWSGTCAWTVRPRARARAPTHHHQASSARRRPSPADEKRGSSMRQTKGAGAAEAG
ncbi:MAG: hypothetical protein ACRDHP_12525 [Ktedonobacterales bacterium]